MLPAIDGDHPDGTLAMAAKRAPRLWQVRYGLLLTFVAVFAITVAEVGITLLGKQILSLNPSGIARFFLVCSGLMILVQMCVFPVCMRRVALPALIASALLLAAAGLLLIPYSVSAP